MRTLNSLKNMSASIIQMAIGTILGFVVRNIFIHTLGIDYQGLNGFFSSVLFMLSIAELGIGTAIIFNMYPFIAAKDTEHIKALMHFYRNCYRLVAVVVTALGLILMPFLSFFGNFHNIHENVYVLYLLYLSSTIASYLFSYKRSILYADQKNYVLNLADTLNSILTNVFYLIVLLIFHSFIGYLLVTLIFTILENLILTYYVNQRYPYLKEKNIQKLDASIIQKFKKQIYGMLFHNIGNFIVFGTDNLIITRFLGLVTMGMYSNYLLITNSIGSLLSAIIGSITASVGNLLTEKDPKKSFQVYKNISLATFWIYSFASIGCFICFRSFIQVWLGHQFVLAQSVALLIALNFYIQGMRKPIQIFQNASGIFYENRHVPVIEAIANFGLSLLFVFFFGLGGVLLGTLVSTMILYSYSFPKYIYAPVFHRKNIYYVWEQLRFLIIFLLALALTEAFSYFLVGTLNAWPAFFSNVGLSLLVPNLFFFLLFRKSEEFSYFVNLGKRLIPKKGN